MTDSTCEMIQSLSNDDIWAFFEANLDKEKEKLIRTHVITCTKCLESFSVGTQRINDLDEKRYNLFHQEILTVRRAELLRFCNKRGVEIDVLKIENSYDYFKYAIGAMIPKLSEAFYEAWDSVEDSVKDEIVLEIMKTVHNLG